MQEHAYSLSAHQLKLGICRASCQWRSRELDHWHEECDCGVEFALGEPSTPHQGEIEILELIDHAHLGF